MHKTKNDLPEPVRVKMIALLNEELANALDLVFRCKQAHWNVKGASFIALHQLFDKLAEDAQEYSDTIAERAVALGGIAEGLLPLVLKRSKLGEVSLDVFEGRDHLESLSSNFATFGRRARHAIHLATEFADLDTADLFTQLSRGLDQNLWLLEAHLQGRW
jgi:starvation-inducible DNA-binding protein